VKTLHSRYNPQAEAERYLAAIPIPPETRCFVLIEPGRGYLIPILARRFPGARIIVLHAAPRQGEQNGGAVHWDPDSARGPEDFLERELEAAGLSAADPVKIIEWRPALDFYGKAYVKILTAAAAALRRFDAGRRTLRAFGRRWFRNFFKNLGLLRSFPVYRELDIPILVTGAGPSLEGSLPLIKRFQQRGFIIAASSSSMALLRGGIIPDLVLSTDGGSWALLHLYELFRGLRAPRPVPSHPVPSLAAGIPSLAAAFSAGLPSQCGDLPILGISDGSLWQGLILRGLGIPHLAFPQRGTVSAAGLDLAFALGRGKVYIAGMDLDTRDIRTHCRPYSFERLQREGATRLRPEYGGLFSRSLAMREGGSHRIYAEWFASRLGAYAGRLYTLGENSPLFGDLPRLIPETPPPEQGKGKRSAAGPLIQPLSLETPVPKALAILKKGLEAEKTARSLAGELGPLLLPDLKNPGPGELWMAAQSLAEPGGGPGG
jgi:hypothetical protein